MPKLFFLLLSSIMFFSCGQSYKLNGTSSVSLLDGKMLFIKISQNGERINIDSAEIVHGSFKMGGHIDSSVMASLYMDDRLIMPFVMEKGNIKVSIDNSGVDITGTPLNDKFNKFVLEQNLLNDRADEVERLESRMIMDGHNYEDIQVEINKQRQDLSDDMNKLVKEFISENYENILGCGTFSLLCSDMINPMSSPLVQEIYKEAPQSFKINPYVKKLFNGCEESDLQIDNVAELN